jgi:UDP-N-acetylmuramoylalanine--D-glutamate ligase
MKQRIVILGGGESGVGAAILARHQGYEVFLSDHGPIASEKKEALQDHQISFEENGHSPERIFSAEEVVKSPGIPDDTDIITRIKAQHIPVVSEIEFAMSHSKAKFIGITGTNGKTTTTLLTYHILKEAGYDVGIAGNVGFSLAQQVATADKTYFVVELSSFQLDGMRNAKVQIGVLLNITPDHLDRYDNDFSKYVASKFRITRHMAENDTFIYNESDPCIAGEIKKLTLGASQLAIADKESKTAQAYFGNDRINFRTDGVERAIAINNLPLRGTHNMMNAMAAVLVARNLGADWQGIENALKSFKNAPHRLEFCGDVENIAFYNDSKATNVKALWFALQSFERPIVLIMGGVDKGNDYSEVDALVKKRVKSIIALGTDLSKIHAHFSSLGKEVVRTTSMAGAVEAAYDRAVDGEVVLLSPACASFDLFRNYEDRGWQFKKAVKDLWARVESKTTTIS